MVQLQRSKWPNDGPAIRLYINAFTLLCLVLYIEITPEIS